MIDHDSYIKKRDAIVAGQENALKNWMLRCKNDTPPYLQEAQIRQEIKTETKDAIDALFLEVVGEDVDAYRMSGGSITKLNIYQYQNSLRSELRQVIKGDKHE